MHSLVYPILLATLLPLVWSRSPTAAMLLEPLDSPSLFSSFLTPTGTPYSWVSSSWSSSFPDSPRGWLTSPASTVPCPPEIYLKQHVAFIGEHISHLPLDYNILGAEAMLHSSQHVPVQGTEQTLKHLLRCMSTDMDTHPKKPALVNLRSSLQRKAALFNRSIRYLQLMYNVGAILPTFTWSFIALLYHSFFSVFVYLTPLCCLSFQTSLLLNLGYSKYLSVQKKHVTPIHKNLIKPLNKYHLSHLFVSTLGYCGIPTQ